MYLIIDNLKMETVKNRTFGVVSNYCGINPEINVPPDLQNVIVRQKVNEDLVINLFSAAEILVVNCSGLNIHLNGPPEIRAESKIIFISSTECETNCKDQECEGFFDPMSSADECKTFFSDNIFISIESKGNNFLPKSTFMKNIATITKKEIISCDFPLHNILENSVFYPCSAMDGSVIKNLSKEYRSKYLKAIGWNHTASVLYEVFTRRRAGLFATMTNFGVLLPISNKIRKIGKWTK